ncbi:hypothetical protein BJY01DRAFT_118308 [Aspergillus pseudoustus]|uniref:GPI ethanolamine phosphate transferase 2 n=1 Tax=Aspergillus pseudoustus TaxID=1810923 RepID=A0ABR4ISA0_9EURO
MHYLGLDHIGHKAGPQSSHMIPKQHEMDSIVSQVYQAIEQETHLHSTLFVLCGDHGMNDAGNHGGSSAGETSPAVLFISPRFRALDTNRQSPADALRDLQYYRVVDQTDITPTLAGLLGLPIPLNSLGVFIPEFLDMWHTSAERLELLLANSKQLLRTLTQTYPSYDFDTPATCHVSSDSGNLEKAHCAWARVKELLSQEEHAEIETILLQLLRTSQAAMSSAASNYELPYLFLGICIAGVASVLSLPASYEALRRYQQPGLFLVASILSYGIMMFASSYVEEEQQFWYWAFTGWAVYLHVRSFQLQPAVRAFRSSFLLTTFGAVALTMSHRILRRWNQTGQKFAAEPDIARTYFSTHQGTLWTLVVLTYADIYLCLVRNDSSSSPTWYLSCLAVTVVAFTFKLAFATSESPELVANYVATTLRGIPLIPYARVVMSGIAILCLSKKKRDTRIKSPPRSLHSALTLFLVTQSRVTNIPIFLVFRLQLKILASMNLASVEVTVTSLFMQYITFFAFGGSNAISSIDLSNAYNGVGNYNLVLVGILTFVSNWAGPIWWVSASKLLRSKRPRGESQTHVALLTLCVACMLLSVMAACTVLRTHLFIWTVFSPKYLYTMSWAIIHHFAVNLLGDIDLLFSSAT